MTLMKRFVELVEVLQSIEIGTLPGGLMCEIGHDLTTCGVL
jgi:hypothetical protein